MLDIELIQSRPALQLEYRISLATDLLHSLSLVMDAPWIEGLDQWVYATHAALPATLKSDMEAVLVLVEKSEALSMRLHRLPPDHAVHRDFSAFINWLTGFSEQDFRDLTSGALERLALACCEDDELQVSPADSIDSGQFKNFLDEKFGGERADRILALADNPLEFKAQLISVLTRFWEQFYQKEYDSNVPLMVRSVEYHRRQTYIGDLTTIFAAITGRRFPYEKMAHADVEKVIFYPSCHIGPYVYFGSCPDPEHVLRLHYNCRLTGTPEREPTTPTTQDLFPPLKALADETRLQILSLLDGRELYAQEIVDQLDISQSAVSRHLKLMVTGGLLTVRKEDSMKYFSINTGTLAAAADRLKSFRGKTP